MLEVADIFRRHGQEYRERYQDHMLPGHLRAMRDIENCRTEVMGGHVYVCENEACKEMVYTYHSSKTVTCLPVGTAVPNAKTTRLSSGSINSATGYCRFPTFWSPSPCPRN